MSQTRLGELVGVTFQQIQKYEKGANRISAARMQQLAEALEVGLEYFYAKGLAGRAVAGFAEAAPQGFPAAVASARSEGLKLNRAFARIRDPKVRASVIALVESLAASDADAIGGEHVR